MCSYICVKHRIHQSQRIVRIFRPSNGNNKTVTATTSQRTTTIANSTMDSFEDGNDHPKKSQAKKKIYFAPPVVGFFRDPHQQHKEKPLLRDSISKKNVTFQVDPTPASSSDEDDEEYGSISSIARARRSGSYGSITSSLSMNSTNGRKRTGKELWAIVRRHVLHSEFHIRDTVRQASLFQSEGPGSRRNNDVHFRDIDLPYDFTLLDCFLALLAYLAISVIAYSFVFEKWSVIDSMYFAVVTFTTIGTWGLGGWMRCEHIALEPHHLINVFL